MTSIESVQKVEANVWMESESVSAALGAITKMAVLEPVEFAPAVKDLISTRIVTKIILNKAVPSLPPPTSPVH